MSAEVLPHDIWVKSAMPSPNSYRDCDPEPRVAEAIHEIKSSKYRQP